MSEQKVRRKTFLLTIGSAALGWLGATASGSAEPGGISAVSELKEKKSRVQRDPRTVPCSGRTL